MVLGFVNERREDSDNPCVTVARMRLGGIPSETL